MDMDIKSFFQLQKKWATWEEKQKDLAAYLSKIAAKFKGRGIPDPSLRKESDLLKAIIDELKRDVDEVREKMKDLDEAYLAPLKEIYKMPGCIDELVEMLKSHPTIGMVETEMIKDEWYDQYNHDRRELKLKEFSFTSEREIKKREKFLTRKCVEIDKASAEVEKMLPEASKVLDLYRWANLSLSLVLKVPDNKYRSSSSPLRLKRTIPFKTTLRHHSTLGFVLLGGVQVHALNMTGLVINTAGGVWYSYAKYQQKKSKPRKVITSDEEATTHLHK